jgi:sigma-E factor negative regulatory protein RseA
MHEKLSAFLDNELSELEERQLLKALGEDEALRQRWERYHLIRAALRSAPETPAAGNVAARVQARLAAEPAPQAWRRLRPATRTLGGLAIAATVAAVTLVGLTVLKEPAPAPTVASTKPGSAVKVAKRWKTEQPEIEPTLNAYLVEHNEYAAGSVSGMLPYVRVVGYGSARDE